VAGRDNTTVPLHELAKLQESSLDNIEFLVMEDDHGLYKSMIKEDQLRVLINANSQSTMTTNRINNTIKRLRRIRTEIIESN